MLEKCSMTCQCFIMCSSWRNCQCFFCFFLFLFICLFSYCMECTDFNIASFLTPIPCQTTILWNIFMASFAVNCQRLSDTSNESFTSPAQRKCLWSSSDQLTIYKLLLVLYRYPAWVYCTGTAIENALYRFCKTIVTVLRSFTRKYGFYFSDQGLSSAFAVI